MVVVITDGSETNQLADLKITMQKFNNYSHPIAPYTLSNTKPHLYVIGINNGFYVDGDGITGRQILSRENDPNFNPSLNSQSETSRVAPSLVLSLRTLLNIQTPAFPMASDPVNFANDDYIGFPNFSFIGDEVNEAFLSTNIARSFIAMGKNCGPKLGLNRCDTCFSFQPEPGKVYVLNAWAKEELNTQVQEYLNPKVKISFLDNDRNPLRDFNNVLVPSITATTTGDIIEGWQRIWKKFEIPSNTGFINFELVNDSDSNAVFFDDLRIYPVKGSMKSFVYDPETFRLMSELDENNYATYYEYDNEGGLVRVKKETSQGIKTIQETRSGNVINKQ